MICVHLSGVLGITKDVLILPFISQLKTLGTRETDATAKATGLGPGSLLSAPHCGAVCFLTWPHPCLPGSAGTEKGHPPYAGLATQARNREGGGLRRCCRPSPRRVSPLGVGMAGATSY